MRDFGDVEIDEVKSLLFKCVRRPATCLGLASNLLCRWLRRLAEVREVVCVTAEENYRLQVLEKSGVTGWDKYEIAGITWASDVAHRGPSMV